MTPMKVLSIRYRFCASIDPVTYESFDIKGVRNLEAMRNTRPLPDTPLVGYITRNRWFLVAGTTSTYSAWQSTSNWGRYETPRRKDDVLPMASTEPIPTEPEDVEGGSDEEEDLRFRAYSPPAHMHNFDLSADNALEFPNLPYRTRDHTSSLLDSSEFEVGKEFSNKDSFLGALKQHSINNGVNYYVVKSKSDKFEAKCAVQDGSCSWKIYASLRKRTGLWEIKKYKGPHTCAAGISQDHPKMDSAMLASLILPTVKADLRTSVLVLIANIRNQMGYTPSYRKAWIAKQKALEKMHSGGTIFETSSELCRPNAGRPCMVRKEFDKPHQGIIGGQYRVHLRHRTCDCGRFDTLRYPCAHVIAACQNLRLDPMSYVDDVYKLENMYNMWRHILIGPK
ncbi:hypothetical protein GOBAR_AA21823 [Gossypium barbadense]|uniref:SWIM-type domain-containing protein n=1 Tax=Gossypium barbadense TaxID=3634 RepID=A0A2P5X671_GOSBA|nr:hypothetical protein GOBAR_AA21823 [Gossypium barbadense]